MSSRDATFGQQLRTFRLRAGLSQATLAEKAGLAAASVGVLERGVRQLPHPQTLAALAGALGLSDDERATLIDLTRRPAEPLRDPPPPAVAALRPSPPKLPLALTPLLGRDSEIAAVGNLLDQLTPPVRLLTLAGPGGVGKTRLALQLGHVLRERFADGAALVELAPLADAGLVPETVADVLGVRDHATQPAIECLLRALDGRQLLLVLDNCEHLVQACAELADTLLRRCPSLTILATSREPLAIGGETVWRVAPLALPHPSATAFEQLRESPAVRLFAECARSQQPEFELADDNAAVIARICRQLDGLPLAIQLAAARTRVLSLEEIEARLADRLRLLVGKDRTAPRRHQTARSTLDWSFELLSERQQRLFQYLGVFAGGCTLAAAEAVGSDGDLSRDDVLNELSELVNKSLVRAERDADGSVRFRLLQTAREYALERLGENGRQEAAQRQHAWYYLSQAEQAMPKLTGGQQRLWLDRLERDHDNYRAALVWSVDRGEDVVALRLGRALWRFWLDRGHLAEGDSWLSRLLESNGGDALLRANALFGAGMLAAHRGDALRARTCFESSRALAAELNQAPAIAAALTQLGHLTQSDTGAARALYEEALAIRRSRGDRWGEAISLSSLAKVAWREGDLRAARSLTEQSLRLVREFSDDVEMGNCLLFLAWVDRVEGQLAAAHRHLAEALEAYWQAEARPWLVVVLIRVAELALAAGQPEGALKLLSAASRHRSAFDYVGPTMVSDSRLDATIATARAALDGRRADSAWAAGQHWSLEDAVAVARALPAGFDERTVKADPRPPGGLTVREADVLRLVAAGRSNLQIAASLVLSVRTVERHITNLYAKIGATNKAEATAFALRHGLG